MEEIDFLKKEIVEIKDTLESIKSLLKKNDEKMDNHISFIMSTYKTLEPVINVLKTVVSPITFPLRWTTRMILS
tara:strand:+ start:2205 stop:2426 length:222 start_codon:yes stop_codon:yes gene_type:complete